MTLSFSFFIDIYDDLWRRNQFVMNNDIEQKVLIP